jgi:glycine/D-amino acid oxidase-like deaminating enzyme
MHAAYADATVGPVWREQIAAREPHAALAGATTADLCVVGGGFTGLWAALRAKALEPERDVVLLEMETAGFGGSGRNGGFADASLTHGLANGLSRFPGEMPAIERLARENWGGFVADIASHGIDCELEETGSLFVVLEPYQDPWVEEEAALLRRFGYEVETFDTPEAMQAEVASPAYRGGVWVKDGAGLVQPVKLAEGLLAAAVRAGVRVHEHSRATRLDGTSVATEHGRVDARRVLLATNAYAPLVRSVRRRVVAVYDHVLATEPLSAEQRATIGWKRRQGLSDGGNQFHYYRLTADDRIVWGGYDAVYRRSVDPRHDDHEPTFARLSEHFFATFPQLEGVRFSHRWGGAIDTCSRFSAFWGTAHGGTVAYAVGYTGLGVVASRFGAHVALDLLDGRTPPDLEMVRRKPVPFPPEPLRTAVIELTRNRLAAADRNAGHRGLWLRTLDRLGLGFDS